VNDTTRELGGTLGVAVIGSGFVSIYQEVFSGQAARGIPEAALEPARESIGAALIAAQALAAGGAPDAASSLGQVASNGFVDGLQAGCVVASAVCAVGAVVCFVFLPAQPAAESALGDEAAGELDDRVATEVIS